MPAELATVTIAVGQSGWAAVGQVVFVLAAGYVQVTAVPTTNSITIKNLKDTPNLAYMGNAAPTTVIASGSMVTPGGVQGPLASSSLFVQFGDGVNPPTFPSQHAIFYPVGGGDLLQWDVTSQTWK